MRVALLAVIAFLFAPVVMAGHSWRPVGPEIVAALDVDAQGRVTHTQLVGSNILPALQTLAAQATRNWKFVPATVDGKPAPSRTYATLAAEARKIDGNEQLRLRYVGHGPGRAFFVIPAYPPKMIQQNIEAKVTAEASVEADGTLSDVHIVDAKTTDGAKGDLFYRVVIEAFKKDRYLPELVDGRPVITHIRMPVTFCFVNDMCILGKRDHAKDAPHDASGNTLPGTTTFADVPIALDSPLKLVSVQP